jgi:endonuclease G, mitochondrial
MAARRRKSSLWKSSKLKWKRKALILVNVLILIAGGIWYAQQPKERKEEIHLLVENYLDKNKKVSLPELAWDLWNYYSGSEFINSEFRGDSNQIYAGVPAPDGLKYSVKILQNTAYTVGYVDAIKNPVWAAYRLFDPEAPETPGKRPDFSEDSRTRAEVNTRDYTNSGYDRGHLAPNYGIARCYGRKAQLETFLMSNIVAQKHEMNAGPWEALESKIANNYTARFKEIWIFAGPIFSDKPNKTPGGVPIPVATYKIIIDETVDGIRSLAFIMPQGARETDPPDKYLTSINEIEKLTGLDFLVKLEDSVEESLEVHKSHRIW